MSRIAAVDPGLSGAIAFFDAGRRSLERIVDMPTTPRVHGKGMKVDPYRLAEVMVHHIGYGGRVVIERVNAMPGQGVTSMFHFGESVGVIEGVAACSGWSIDWITPQQWKRYWSLIGKDKGAALTIAREQWPELHTHYFGRQKDIGRADAALLGAFYLDR